MVQKKKFGDEKVPDLGDDLSDIPSSAVIRVRNKFYKDLSRRTLLVAIMSLLVATISLILMVTVFLMKPDAKYFTTEDGRVTPVFPVTELHTTQEELVDWVAKAVNRIVALDFLNYRDQLAEVEHYFTREGYEAYLIALRDSGNLASVLENAYVVSVIPNGAPRIIGQGEVDGAIAFRIQVPIVISYHGPRSTRNQNSLATVLVKRAPYHVSKERLVIHQLIIGS